MLYILTEYFFCVLAAFVLTTLWFLCMVFVTLFREGLAYVSQALRRASRPTSPDSVSEFLFPSAPLGLALTQEGPGRNKR